MKIAKYIVKFFDEDANAWFDGSYPVSYKEARRIASHYADIFETKIVFAA